MTAKVALITGGGKSVQLVTMSKIQLGANDPLK